MSAWAVPVPTQCVAICDDSAPPKHTAVAVTLRSFLQLETIVADLPQQGHLAEAPLSSSSSQKRSSRASSAASAGRRGGKRSPPEGAHRGRFAHLRRCIRPKHVYPRVGSPQTPCFTISCIVVSLRFVLGFLIMLWVLFLHLFVGDHQREDASVHTHHTEHFRDLLQVPNSSSTSSRTSSCTPS